MARPAIIGLCGKARVGKDEVGNFILAHQGGYRYSFADPLRAMLVPLGIDMSDPYWQARKEDPIPALGVSPRRMMQTLGTEWGRELVNPDFWLLMAKQRLLNNGPGMVVTDVRFPNEADWVRKHGLLIHVLRPDAKEIEAHTSESGVEINRDTDLQLFNTGTLDELQIAVRNMLSVYD